MRICRRYRAAIESTADVSGGMQMHRAGTAVRIALVESHSGARIPPSLTASLATTSENDSTGVRVPTRGMTDDIERSGQP